MAWIVVNSSREFEIKNNDKNICNFLLMVNMGVLLSLTQCYTGHTCNALFSVCLAFKLYLIYKSNIYSLL